MTSEVCRPRSTIYIWCKLVNHRAIRLTGKMFRNSAHMSHLLPDVVMREETTQFPFSKRTTMIRVLVSWQHMNPQRLDISLIHRSERRGNEARGNNTSYLSYI